MAGGGGDCNNTCLQVFSAEKPQAQGSITLGPRGRKSIAKQPPEPSDHRDVEGEAAETRSSET